MPHFSDHHHIDLTHRGSQKSDLNTSDIEENVGCFVDLVATETGRFITERTNLLYDGHYNLHSEEETMILQQHKKIGPALPPSLVEASMTETSSRRIIAAVVLDQIF